MKVRRAVPSVRSFSGGAELSSAVRAQGPAIVDAVGSSGHVLEPQPTVAGKLPPASRSAPQAAGGQRPPAGRRPPGGRQPPPRRRPWSHAQVKKLMLAVLLDAVRMRDRLVRKRQRTGAQNRSLEELREWFLSDEVEHPFSFRVICETLGLDTECLRRGILG